MREVGLGALTFPRASKERSSAESKILSNAEKVGTCGFGRVGRKLKDNQNWKRSESHFENCIMKLR